MALPGVFEVLQSKHGFCNFSLTDVVLCSLSYVAETPKQTQKPNQTKQKESAGVLPE